MGLRVAVLTEAKSLQDQIAKDFGGIGLFDMRGLRNYTCAALANGGQYEDMWAKKWGRPTCDVGPCTAGLRCDLKDEGCEYFDAYRRTCSERLVSTNYAYWIAIHKYGQGLGKFDLLVLDECHLADSALSSAMSVEFTDKDYKELGSKPPKVTAPLQNWRMWGRVQLDRVQGKLDFYTRGAKIGAVNSDGTAALLSATDVMDASELRFWKNLEGKCMTLAESTDDWILEKEEVSGNVRIAPAWVRNYAEPLLFRDVPRVVLMSATVRPKITNLLGIGDGAYDFYEYPSTFPVERRPIYWIPTVSLNYNSTENDLITWTVRIDQILARRLDRKGIVHTVSYERQKFLMEHSRFKHLMHANNSNNTRDVVQSFRNAPAPAILVSPSVGTGFDFPFDFCRYQIIGKVPFKDARGAILTAQSKDDPDYLMYLTAQDITQMYGRSNRDARDFSETIIVDNNIEWFLSRYGGYRYDEILGCFDMTRKKTGPTDKHFFPEYLLEAFQRVDGVPDPPTLKDIAA